MIHDKAKTKKAIGQNVRAARKRINLTQVRLAEQAKVDQAIVSRLERGNFSPSAIDLLNIAEVLGVTVESLAQPVSDRELVKI